MEAVKNWRACIHEPGSGPLTGHYARRVPVTQGHLQAHADGSVRACRHNGRDLPSWPCEFDSRHPLHSVCPSQARSAAPGGNRTVRPGSGPYPNVPKLMTAAVRLERPMPPRWPDPASWCDADRSTQPACSRVRDDPSAREYWRPRTRRSGSPSAGDHGNEDPRERHRQPPSSPGPLAVAKAQSAPLLQVPSRSTSQSRPHRSKARFDESDHRVNRTCASSLSHASRSEMHEPIAEVNEQFSVLVSLSALVKLPSAR
jgi:hypothetical protein